FSNLIAVTIGEGADDDHDEINQRPDPKDTKCKKVENPGSDLSHVKSMKAENTEKETKNEGGENAFIYHGRMVWVITCSREVLITWMPRFNLPVNDLLFPSLVLPHSEQRRLCSSMVLIHPFPFLHLGYCCLVTTTRVIDLMHNLSPSLDTTGDRNPMVRF